MVDMQRVELTPLVNSCEWPLRMLRLIPKRTLNSNDAGAALFDAKMILDKFLQSAIQPDTRV